MIKNLNHQTSTNVDENVRHEVLSRLLENVKNDILIQYEFVLRHALEYIENNVLVQGNNVLITKCIRLLINVSSSVLLNTAVKEITFKIVKDIVRSFIPSRKSDMKKVFTHFRINAVNTVIEEIRTETNLIVDKVARKYLLIGNYTFKDAESELYHQLFKDKNFISYESDGDPYLNRDMVFTFLVSKMIILLLDIKQNYWGSSIFKKHAPRFVYQYQPFFNIPESDSLEKIDPTSNLFWKYELTGVYIQKVSYIPKINELLNELYKKLNIHMDPSTWPIEKKVVIKNLITIILNKDNTVKKVYYSSPFLKKCILDIYKKDTNLAHSVLTYLWGNPEKPCNMQFLKRKL